MKRIAILTGLALALGTGVFVAVPADRGECQTCPPTRCVRSGGCPSRCTCLIQRGAPYGRCFHIR